MLGRHWAELERAGAGGPLAGLLPLLASMRAFLATNAEMRKLMERQARPYVLLAFTIFYALFYAHCYVVCFTCLNLLLSDMIQGVQHGNLQG